MMRKTKKPSLRTIANGWYWVEIGDALEVVLIEDGTSWAAGSDVPVEANDLKIIKRIDPPEGGNAGDTT